MSSVNKDGGIISINHPGIPSSEACMGCGWQIGGIPDKVITAVELINGGSMKYGIEGSIQGWDQWHRMLGNGGHVTAIGGSDDHRAGSLGGSTDRRADGIGRPTTVIYMKELSVQGLLDGIRSGRVFIDVEGDKNHFLDLCGSLRHDTVYMGGVLSVLPSDTIHLTASVKGVGGGRVEFIIDGKLNASLNRTLSSDDEKIQVSVPYDHTIHFIYIKVRDKDGKLVLVGNPLYIYE
jgi:hypothetical protein